MPGKGTLLGCNPGDFLLSNDTSGHRFCSMLPQHRPYRGSGEGNIGDEISIGKWRLAFQGRPHTAIGRKVGIAWVEIIVCFR